MKKTVAQIFPFNIIKMSCPPYSYVNFIVTIRFDISSTQSFQIIVQKVPSLISLGNFIESSSKNPYLFDVNYYYKMF